MAFYRQFLNKLLQQHNIQIINFKNVKCNANISTFYSRNQPLPIFNLNHNCKTQKYRNSRYFHRSQLHSQKVRFEAENSYAYRILRTRTSFKDTLTADRSAELQIIDINKDEFQSTLAQHWRNESATNILIAFKKVYNYAKQNNISVSDNRFDNLVDGLMDKCQDLTDEELSELLIYLQRYPHPDSVTSHNFHDIWSALDDICCWRLPSWPVNKILLFADHWYVLGLTKYSDYTAQAIKRISRKVRHLNAAELVQTFFYINIRRKQRNMFDFEYQLEQYIHELTVDELAIISMGFFKTKTVIKNIHLLTCMLDKVLNETKTINEISLAAILKIIRYSPHLPLVDKLQELLTKLVPEIDRLSILCCIHIALVGTVAQFFHPEILSRISQKLTTNITTARLKDMERLTFALTLFNFNPKTNPCIFESILKELRSPERQKEFETHPRSIACCIHFLSLQQYYPYDLISNILDPEFLNNTYGNNKKSIGREILFMDTTVKIDCPDYKGNRLNDKLQKNLTKWTVNWIPSKNQNYRLSTADKLMLDILEIVQNIQGGEEYVDVNYILPHFQKPDIILCKDKDGQPVKINNFAKYTLGDIMKPRNKEEFIWYAIVVASWNSYIRDTILPVGTTNTKLRQLKRIGYIPVMIPWNDYWHRTQEQKVDYIRKKIS